jgi:MFS transporter, OFA family, oxalate/formate antiporter
MEVAVKTRGKLFYGWVIVMVSIVIAAILIGSRQSYGVFFTSIENEFGLNRAETSGIFSAFMAFSAIFSAIGGWALDKFGPKKTIATMGLFTGAGLLISSQVQSAWQLYLTYSILMAVGTGEAYTIIVGFVSRWFRKKRGLALGLATSGGGVGTLVYAPFASYLIISFDWRNALIVLGLIALVVVILASLLLKGYPREIGLYPDGDKSDTEVKANNAPAGYGFTEALKTRQFWFIFTVWLFQGIAVYIITTHIIPYATDAGISEMAAATIISVNSVFNIIGALSAGALSDKFGRKTISIIYALIGAASLIWLLTLLTNIWLLFIFAAIFGLSFGGVPNIISAYTGDIFGTRNIGTIMGAIGVAWFIGAAIGAIVGGAVFDLYKSYFIAFLFGVFCMLVVTLFLAILTKPKIAKTKAESPAAG